MKQKILSLAGDGIGQEVVPVSIEVLKAVTSLVGRDIEIVHGLVAVMLETRLARRFRTKLCP